MRGAAIVEFREHPGRNLPEPLSPLRIRARCAARALADAASPGATSTRSTTRVSGSRTPPGKTRVGQRVVVRWEDHEALAIPLFRPA